MQPDKNIKDVNHPKSVSAAPGGRNALRKPAAPLSFWGKIKQQIKGVEIDLSRETLANDNLLGTKSKRKLSHMLAYSGVFIMSVAVLGLNSSAIATQVVLNSSDKVLSTSMEVSPDALAHLLNAINVGEQ